MLGPYQIPHLVRYFDGIDLAVSRRMLRAAPPSEPTLTEEFCALMDAQTQRRERSLDFDSDALTQALTRHGSFVDVDFSIEVHRHSPAMEAYVSQADFGLVLEYQNTVYPSYGWTAAYLMQAKRLFATSSGYSVYSRFGSTDADQHVRIRALARVLGEEALKYCLYCPPTSGYDARSIGALRTLHETNLADHIFDYAAGLALHAQIQRTGGVESGMWVAGTHNEPANAAGVHADAFRGSWPLTWFIVQHFAPHGRFAQGKVSWNEDPSEDTARVKDIATGDSTAVEALIDELGDEMRDTIGSGKHFRVLPGSSVTVRIRVGPAEGLDLPLEVPV